MRKRSSLALLAIATFAVAVVTGLGAGAAFAGEVTGNCNNADNAKAQENCKGQEGGEGTRVSNGSSWCSFSDRTTIRLKRRAPVVGTRRLGTHVPSQGGPGPDPSELKGRQSQSWHDMQ